jgi:hypothetical protein
LSRHIDALIIILLESLCHGFERVTGMTNYRIAGWTGWGILICLAVGTLEDINKPYGAPVIILFYALYGPLASVTLVINLTGGLKNQEHEAIRRLAMGYANPQKIRDSLIKARVVGVLSDTVLTTLTLGMIMGGYPLSGWFIGLFWLSTLWSYLLACDPLPPGSVTLKQWIQSFWPRVLARQESPL